MISGRTVLNSIRKLVRLCGFDVVRYDGRTAGAQIPLDFDQASIETILSVSPFTQTSPERIFALCNAVKYIVANKIPGAMVECGVWKGGSMAAIARTLIQLEDYSRDLYLYDTFEGMTRPGEKDIDYTGVPASILISKMSKGRKGWRWNYVPLDEVKRYVLSIGYSEEKFHFIKGEVVVTLPSEAPQCISLLRLDTDWYESTRHELVTLFPRISPGGVLIIDDYGHFAGARQAVDEYIQEHRIPMLLHRIDYTGRIGVVSGV
jgi:O-methyltransferase